MQARSLEVLQSLGLADELVAPGNPSARLMLHLSPRRAIEVALDAVGAVDIRFPLVLFVS